MHTKHEHPQGSVATEERSKNVAGTTEAKPQSTENKSQTGATKPQAPETKPQATETKPQAGNTQQQAGQTKPQGAESKPQGTDAKPQGSEAKTPTGAAKDDHQASKASDKPGDEHKQLAQSVGTWKGKQTSWSGAGATPVSTECLYTVSPIMDGRFIKAEATGGSPKSGHYEGLGFTGFDQATKQVVGTWMNTMGTGIMNGSGECAPDGKSLTMTYTANCAVSKKPVSIRKVETYASPDAWTMEMFAPDAKTGAEFKTMRIEFARKS